jgi:hypothetical protein
MSLSLLGLAPSAELIVEVSDAESRKKVEVKNDKGQKACDTRARVCQEVLTRACPWRR